MCASAYIVTGIKDGFQTCLWFFQLLIFLLSESLLLTSITFRDPQNAQPRDCGSGIQVMLDNHITILSTVIRYNFNGTTIFIHANLFRIQFQNSKTSHCPCAQVIKAESTLKCQSVMNKHNMTYWWWKKTCRFSFIIDLINTPRHKLPFWLDKDLSYMSSLPRKPLQQVLLWKWSMFSFCVLFTLLFCGRLRRQYTKGADAAAISSFMSSLNSPNG